MAVNRPMLVTRYPRAKWATFAAAKNGGQKMNSNPARRDLGGTSLRTAWCLGAAGLLLWAGYVVGRRMPCNAHSPATAPAPAVIQAPVLPAAAPEPTAPPSPRPPAAHQPVVSEPVRDDFRAQELARAAIDPNPVSRVRKLMKMGVKPSNDDFRAAMPASVMQWKDGTNAMQDIRAMLDVLSQWVAVDAAAGAAWIMQLPEVPWPECRPKNDALYRYMSDWTRLDAAAAESWLGTFPPCRSRDVAISCFVQGLLDAGFVETDPQRIASWCTQVRDRDLQVNPLYAFASAWCRKDIDAAAAWFNSISPSPGKDFAMSTLVPNMASEYPVHAMAWAVSIADEEPRANAIGHAMQSWAKKDPAGASQFLSKMEDGKSRDIAICGFAGQLVSSDPATAMEWAETVSDMGTRQRTMDTVADTWLRKDRDAAMAWIKKGLLPKTIEDRLLQSK